MMDAANLVKRENFLTFWNTLTRAEKDFYLKTNLPKRVFKRRHALPEDD